ncbi:MAG: hypothetical protein ABIQ09_09635 [Jatrophihabitantaceae bacterium]
MEIDRNEAELLLKRARSDLDKANAAIVELTVLQAQAAGLARLIEGLEMMHPALAQVDEPTEVMPAVEGQHHDQLFPEEPGISRPAARPIAATDLVRQILTESPDRWFTGREMINLFRDRTLPGTETAIRLALKRCAENGFAERVTDEGGGQTFRLHKQEEPNDAGEVSTP